MIQSDNVLDSVNISYWDEDSILDQNYEKQIFSHLYYEEFRFINAYYRRWPMNSSMKDFTN